MRRVRGAGPGTAAAMLDFFTIFSKGGLVLWCFQGVRGPAAAATAPVNALIRSVLLQVRAGLAGPPGRGRWLRRTIGLRRGETRPGPTPWGGGAHGITRHGGNGWKTRAGPFTLAGEGT